jgi:hypothetical protein
MTSKPRFHFLCPNVDELIRDPCPVLCGDVVFKFMNNDSTGRLWLGMGKPLNWVVGTMPNVLKGPEA